MEETVFTIFRILQRDHKTFITILAMICELMINTKLLVDSDNEMYKDNVSASNLDKVKKILIINRRDLILCLRLIFIIHHFVAYRCTCVVSGAFNWSFRIVQ